MRLSPELSRAIARTILGLFFTVLGFALSNRFLFEEKPLFKTPFLGEAVFAIALGLFSVYLLPHWIRNATLWLRKIIALEVRQIVFDFWNEQSRRMAESRRRKQEKKKKKAKKLSAIGSPTTASPILLDTSAVIDGRIVEVIKTGFLDNPILVPSFIIDELQKISDSKDDLRRKRGRRGFEVLEEIKNESLKASSYSVIEHDIKDKDVDKELVKLAKKIKAKIATVDFNLNKASNAKGVRVLNINDLASAIRIDLIPGEKVNVKLVQKGKEETQGVGYLPDGTMIVVEDGGDLIDKKVEVKITRAFQTSAGRMFFARRENS